MKGYLTAGQIRKKYGVTAACVSNWRKCGRLPGWIEEVGRYYYPVKIVKKCVKEQAESIARRHKACRSGRPEAATTLCS